MEQFATPQPLRAIERGVFEILRGERRGERDKLAGLSDRRVADLPEIGDSLRPTGNRSVLIAIREL